MSRTQASWTRRLVELVVCGWLLLYASSVGAESPLNTDGEAADAVQQQVERLAAQARLRGDARRGALLFYKSPAACSKCHAIDAEQPLLGPNLVDLGKEFSTAAIVESILQPSKSLRKGFETVAVLTVDGQVHSGIVVAQRENAVVLRELSRPETELVIAREEIDAMRPSERSLMPEGLLASIGDERNLLDLVRYIAEVAHGGAARAKELQPSADDLLVMDDTADLDHAGILRSLDRKDFDAGGRIYRSECQQCHGADGNTPLLPTARAFGTQELKHGNDPYRMLLTLTNGAGLMTPMQHLSPRQRYQVIHYIREAFMKSRSEAYRPIDEDYLRSLPAGTSDGEPEVEIEPRDFGPVLASQIGGDVNSALTFGLSDNLTFAYDLHRMRSVGVWEGGFLDLSETQHYQQRGERMPQIAGEMVPGINTWGWLYAGAFELPGDAKPPRGPLREDWLRYNGHHLYGKRAILSYAIQGRPVLETLDGERLNGAPLMRHAMRIAAGTQPLILCVGQLETTERSLVGVERGGELQPLAASAPAADSIVVVTGHAKSQAGRPLMANQPRHLVAAPAANELDLGTPGRTILVRFRTTAGGTLIASAPHRGRWKPNGKTLFIRGNRLVFDIGWVGAIGGTSNVADGNWHTAALVVDDAATRLYVDGRLEGERDEFRRPAAGDHVLKIGATATDFGGDFVGDIAWVRIHPRAFSAADLKALPIRDDAPRQLPQAERVDQVDGDDVLFFWNGDNNPESTEEGSEDAASQVVLTAGVVGDVQGCQWTVDEAGRVLLHIPADEEDRVLSIARHAAVGSQPAVASSSLRTTLRGPAMDPESWTRGGPQQWPQELIVQGQLGESINGYALDTIPVPRDNPWNAWLRTSAVDFLSDGRGVVSTHGGDIYLVSGLDRELEQVRWKRFAAGLFEPFGVRVVNDQIYVTCRDGIKRLHDVNGDDEVDFVEAFWSDDDVSSMFHAYNFDLQTDSQGSFYFAKAGQYTQHHRPGTIMRIPAEGGRAEVVAWGLRTPNGMGKLADDRFTVSDNQGPWMPAGKISLIKPNTFLGNMPINAEQDAWLKGRHGGQLPSSFEQPLVWTPQELDNSCGGQLWVDDARFGPLSGHLLHSSFGKGWLYYMSLQEIDGQAQASIVSLPHQWDAGVMRIRVNAADGQVYGVGLSGWQGPAGGDDGCLQRLRYTGGAAQLVERVAAVPGGLELQFSFAVDRQSASQPDAWQAKMWNYLWSARYGSDQFSVLEPGTIGQDVLAVEKVEWIDDRTLRLLIPDLAVCNQLSLEMNFLDTQGKRFVEQVYMTINAFP